ncbi:MAG: hypothetical protein ACRD43_07940, partial [Pyrinomonadaceae bacterium]
MKRKILFSFLGMFIIASSIMTWASRVDAVKSEGNETAFALSVTSNKQAYLLGEPITLNFALKNIGDVPVRLTLNPDVYTGYLKIWIASSDGDFAQYRNSSWGLREKGGKSLDPEQS